MPIDKELLDILCCPKTKIDVRLMTKQEVDSLNEKINKGIIKYVDGDPVEESIEEGLITVDKETVYEIKEDIPVMLIDKGIPFKQ